MNPSMNLPGGDLSNRKLEEALENSLQQAVLALLDAKPANPIAFLASYFQRECEKSNRVAQAAYILEGVSIYHPAIEDRLFRAYDTLAQYKVQPEVRGLTGDIYTDLLAQLLSGLPDPSKLIQKIQCNATEHIPFPVFKAGVLTCLHLKEFMSEAHKLYQDLGGGSLQDKTPRALCETALNQLSTALNSTSGDPYLTVDVGVRRMNIQHLNFVLGMEAAKLEASAEPVMSLQEFLIEAMEIFVQHVPQVK